MNKIKYSNNLSVKNSQLWLYESLIELMKDQSFEKITISEITKNANLDRTTFYRNYDSKLDILNYGINLIKTKYVNRLKYANKLNMKYLSREFFSICLEEIEFLKLINLHNLTPILLLQFNQLLPDIHLEVKEKFNFRIEDTHMVYALYYNTGGFLNILMKWIEDGCDASIDELVASFIEISKFNMSD